MKSNIFTISFGESKGGLTNPKGITLLETLIGLFVFGIVISSCLMLFRKNMLNSRKELIGKNICSEALDTISFVERHIPFAMINTFEGKYRMNFIGENNRIRCICPFSETEGTDLGKLGIFLDGDIIKVNFVRIDKDTSDFSFFAGFPGAQPLAEHISRLRFEYFDGIVWRETWNTKKGQAQEGELPRLLRMEIDVVYPQQVEGKYIRKQFQKTMKMGI